MYPVIFSLGPFTVLGLRIPAITIYSYGVMMALGFMGGAAVTARMMRRKGMDPDWAWSLVVWAAVGGLVGARMLSIADDWQGFLSAPLSSLFSGSGFVWYGGLFGGVAAATAFIFKHRLSWPLVVDCAAPGLALGQALGRIGCQLAGDGDWGRPTSLPWGMRYPNAINHYWDNWLAASGLPADVRVHPTPLYESAAYLAAFLVLRSLGGGERRPGDLFSWYLILVCGARFAVEFVRINPPWFFGFSQAQVISVLLVALGAANLWRGARG